MADYNHNARLISIIKIITIIFFIGFIYACRDITPANWYPSILYSEPLKRAFAILLAIDIIFCIWFLFFSDAPSEDKDEIIVIFFLPFIAIALISLLTMALLYLISYGISGIGLTMRFSFLLFAYSCLTIVLVFGYFSYALATKFRTGEILARSLGKKIATIIALLASGIGLALNMKDIYDLFFGK